MKHPVLVIMAAGMGSRFGGAKQIEPVDEQGHVIMDFSLFDAHRAGFRDLMFIIKPEMEETFRTAIGNRLEQYFNISYVHQTVDALPAGYQVPEGREKPWGTGHAVLCCKPVLDAPFAVINADDFYGPTAFSTMYDFLSNNTDETRYAMVGYRLRNTLSEHGSVARGVCEAENGLLNSVTERSKIFKDGTDAKFTEDEQTFTPLSGDVLVSMNFWGFTPNMLNELERRFPLFLDQVMAKSPLKGEYFLPQVVNDQLTEQLACVQMLPCEETWYGMTYREDLDFVKSAIRRMKASGTYEEHLWK